jgi:hypothetical protein
MLQVHDIPVGMTPRITSFLSVTGMPPEKQVWLKAGDKVSNTNLHPPPSSIQWISRTGKTWKRIKIFI